MVEKTGTKVPQEDDWLHIKLNLGKGEENAAALP